MIDAVQADSTVHSKGELHSMKAATAQTGNIELELIKPLTVPSIYKEFLEDSARDMSLPQFGYIMNLVKQHTSVDNNSLSCNIARRI